MSAPFAGVTETPETLRHFERLEQLSTWLDRRYVDPLIGFVFPGVGDTVGALLGMYGIYVAITIGAHPVVVAKMLLNLAIDALVGTVPFLGAIFDFFYRAHTRNFELLRARAPSGAPTLGDWVAVLGAAAVLLFSLLLPILVTGLLVTWLLRSF